VTLPELVAELASDLGYATGAKKFPHAISEEQAIELALVLMRNVSERADARARAAVENGVTIACGVGCTGCCEEMVIIAEPEALLIRKFLRAPENAIARAHFLDAFARWRARAGDAPERLAALTVSNDDRSAYTEAHTAYWRTRNLCAFNRDGACTIYPVRPLVCRNAHAVETSERCYGDYSGGEQAKQIEFRPMAELLRQAHHLLQAAHNAITDRPNQHQSVCVAVHRLLHAGK
jgi:Fe-S-cluster containining protein